jgi:hypothetical protein
MKLEKEKLIVEVNTAKGLEMNINLKSTIKRKNNS